jgi:hypothetical protein
VQNARVPLPVNTTATAARSFDASRMPRITPLIISVVYEFSCGSLSRAMRVACSPGIRTPPGSLTGIFSTRMPGRVAVSVRSCFLNSMA